MEASAVELRKLLLKHQIELEESNYRYAVELQKDHEVLRRMKLNIQRLKEQLAFLAADQEMHRTED
jgi:hypothetical protein